MNIELPSEMTAFVKSLVDQGRFESETAVLIESLKLLNSRESIRQALQRGVEQLESGQWKDEETVFAKLEANLK